MLAANLAWTTLCLGGYRPETMIVTSALTGALLVTHLLARIFSPMPRSHPAGLLVGSTTHGVLMRAKCPVVIVPPKKTTVKATK